MIEAKKVAEQLKKLKFGSGLLNQAEMRELPHILHEDERIAQCANGYYEGGIALLVATDQRLLLIDKKPFNYMNVEDLRFDMISEIDYSHRLMNAQIIITSGSKVLRFKSYNQARLRHLINLVQERMSQTKKDQSSQAETQQQHLEAINKQLQTYLLAQHQQLQRQLQESKADTTPVVPKPDPQLADYLFAQRLLEQFQRETGSLPPQPTQAPAPAAIAAPASKADLVAEAQREVFGSNHSTVAPHNSAASNMFKGLEVNPLRIAYAKLPMMLRNRKFNHTIIRPSAPPASANQTQPAIY